MRILEVGKFYPPPFGGMETVLRDLVKELSRKAQVDVLVANTSNHTRIEKMGKGLLIRAASIGTLAGVSVCPGMPAILKRLLRSRKYDIVHLHLPNPLAHFSLLLSGWKGKVVVHWHSDIIRQKKFLQLYGPFMNRLLNRVDAIVAATPKHFTSSTQIDFIRHGKKCHSIPFGIDADAFSLNPVVLEQARRVAERFSKPVIFACGRHIYYKGYEYLIRAMENVDGAVLVLGGSGLLTPHLKNVIRELGLEDRVHFEGFIPDAEISSFYHAATIVCMPSVEKSEAFGMVQLEAMACKKPVVCCDLENGVTYVNLDGVTGKVVPPKDSAALAQALNGLLSDPLLSAKMGEAGYRRVREEFTLSMMGGKYLKLFREL